MTPTELVAWQKRNGLRTDAEAALALGLTPQTYWRKRHGKSGIQRQDEMLADYYEMLHQINPVRLAQVGDTINKLIRLSIKRR